jgi:hypothetical protein
MGGWCVGHALNARRNRNNKRREVRVQHLIEAHRPLRAGACRGPIHSTQFGGGFESATADIQLFGTSEQARLARGMGTAIATRQEGASAGPLLLSLRDALRSELGQKQSQRHRRLAPVADLCVMPFSFSP